MLYDMADGGGMAGGGMAEGDEPDRRSIWQRLEEQDREEEARTKGFRLAFFSWLGLNTLFVIGRPAVHDERVQTACLVVLILVGLAVMVLGVRSMRRRHVERRRGGGNLRLGGIVGAPDLYAPDWEFSWR